MSMTCLHPNAFFFVCEKYLDKHFLSYAIFFFFIQMRIVRMSEFSHMERSLLSYTMFL